MNKHYNKYLNTTLAVSSHCQRNWDLSKEMRQEDIKTILTAIKQSPSKQSGTYFKVKATTDRSLIESVYEKTFSPRSVWDYADIEEQERQKRKSQPQILGQLLLAFFEDECWENDKRRCADYFDDADPELGARIFQQNRNQAIGIAVGYVKLTAELLGLKSGCCASFEPEEIKKVFIEKREPLLLMGIGYGDEKRARTRHHVHDHRVEPFRKDIEIEIL